MEKTTQRKTVNIALIGLGFMGHEHAKAYSLAPVIFKDIAATPVKKVVCDINAEAAKKNAERWGFEEWCTDWHEIMERDDIDIVDLCTPPFLHTEMALEAFKHGKFVFCEKPLTTTTEDCEKLISGMHELNGRSATGFCKRRWPAVNYARKMVQEGRLGKIRLYNGRYTQGAGDAFKVYTFRSTVEKGGGFADSCSHVLDMARFILDDQYDEIVGTTDIYTTESYETKPDGTVIPHVKDAEDTSLFIAKMKKGTTVTIYQTYAYLGAGEDISFEVIGEKGTIRWSGANPSVCQVYLSDEDMESNGFRNVLMGPAHPYGEAVPMLPGFGVGVVDQMSFQAYEVIQACVNGTKYTPDFDDTLEIVRVCDAVRESRETKKWVKVQD